MEIKPDMVVMGFNHPHKVPDSHSKAGTHVCRSDGSGELYYDFGLRALDFVIITRGWTMTCLDGHVDKLWHTCANHWPT